MEDCLLDRGVYVDLTMHDTHEYADGYIFMGLFVCFKHTENFGVVHCFIEILYF